MTMLVRNSKLLFGLMLCCAFAANAATAQENSPLEQMQSGLYAAESLQNQGLIIERQGDAVAAYPLIYDEDGNSRWYFSGTFYEDGRYEADLYALSGGQCLGCPAPVMSPELEIVGNILIVVQDPANLLVSINDGQLIEYTSLEYGYETYEVAVGDPIPDLEGQWAVYPIDPYAEDPGPFTTNDPYTFRLTFDSADNPAEFFPPPIHNVYFKTDEMDAGDGDPVFTLFRCGRASTDRATITGRAYCLPQFNGPTIGIFPSFYWEIISADRMQIAFLNREDRDTNPSPGGEFFHVAVRIK